MPKPYASPARFAPVASSVAAALWLTACGSKNEFVTPPPPTVTVQAPIVRTVTTYEEFPGTTTAYETVEVRARVKGILEKIQFEAGDFVQADDVLFVIEQEPFIAAQKVAQGRVASAQAELDLAETERSRKEAAVAGGGISKLDYETAVAKRDAAKAALDIAEADLDQANLDLQYTEVTAPVAGKTSKNLVDIGNLVGAAEATLLTTMVNDEKIFANFEVNERSVIRYLRTREERLRRGVSKAATEWELKLRLADGKVYGMPGEANFFDNVLDADSGTVNARAVFPNPKGHLLAGLFVRVMIPETVEGAVMVPRQSIQRDLDGYYVLIVNAQDVVEKRLVEPGAVVDETLQIVGGGTPEPPGGDGSEGGPDGEDKAKTFEEATSATSAQRGLTGDERIIVRGFQRAREGSKVAPQMVAATPEAPPEPAPQQAE